jgi:hypothetical protein
VTLQLAVGIVVHLAAALVFAVLAMAVGRRAVPGDARPANTLFALWWWCIGLQQLIGATRIALWALGLPLSLQVGLSLVSGAAVMTGLAGLLTYLIYVYTGRSTLRWPLIIFYALYFGWYATLLAGFEPVGVSPNVWNVTFDYTAPPSPTLVITFLAILVGPQLVAGIALLFLALRLPPSAARVRVTTVGAGVLLWFGSTLIGPAAGITGDAWRLVTLLIPLSVGSGVLLVHRPPPWLARRLPEELPRPAGPADAERRPIRGA